METSFSFLGFESFLSIVLILLLVLSTTTTNYSFTTAFLVGLSYDLIGSSPIFGYFSLTFLITVGLLKLLKNTVPVEMLLFILYIINIVVYLILFTKFNIIGVLVSATIYFVIRIFIFLLIKK